MGSDGKTEKASPKKRKDERKKGNVFMSKDVITIVSLLGVFYGIKYLFPFIFETLRDAFIRAIEGIATIQLNENTVREISNWGVFTTGKIIVPIVLIAVVCAIIATGVQTRFLFTSKSFMPQFSRLNPLKGLQNLLALKNVIELLKSILKISILFFLLYSTIKSEIRGIANTMYLNIQNASTFVLSTIMRLIFKIALVFVAVSLFDYFYQWWEYEKKLKMSKQEVKEEYKQMEGNPEVKSKIKEIQRQRASSRMMQSVPEADVIIRNPTHFAVALKYDTQKSNAPILVAKGQDELALRIVQVAKDHQVYTLENKPLARAIYATTEIGQEIPQEYYGAVAEILVYVYQLNNKSVT